MTSMKIFNYHIFFDFKFKRENFSAINLRPFFAGLIAAFIIMIISQLGFQFTGYNKMIKLLNPVDVNAVNIIKNKLQNNGKNDYKLFKETPVVGNSFASADYRNTVSYIVVDLDTGKVITEKNSGTKLPIASLAKIMTAVVALDLAKPSDVFSVSDFAANQTPTKIGVKTGEKLSLEELLHAALMTSANDATQVIKEGIDNKYGGNVFIDAMNEKAKFLGLKNTHFSNAEGYDNNSNYSSAEDLAVLSHFALTNYPLIAEITKKDYQFLPVSNNHSNFFDLYNWNGLLNVYPGVYGLKIGNTDNAKYTTVVVSERSGKKILAVVLGAKGVVERDLIAANLLDLGFENTLGLPAVNVTRDQLMAKYATWKYFN
ncbi:MAG: serine hydrolase [Patescibacteria group bacterium]|nr:serine hydrolase [Patescibacteria group bacterium]